jgi:hypothetical protein
MTLTFDATGFRSPNADDPAVGLQGSILAGYEIADLAQWSVPTRSDVDGGARVLALRPPTLDDEAQVRSAQAELAAEGFTFVFDLEAASWPELLARLERQRRGESGRPGWVPSTFLLAVVGPDVVGRVSIRQELNDFFAPARARGRRRETA